MITISFNFEDMSDAEANALAYDMLEAWQTAARAFQQAMAAGRRRELPGCHGWVAYRDGKPIDNAGPKGDVR